MFNKGYKIVMFVKLIILRVFLKLGIFGFVLFVYGRRYTLILLVYVCGRCEFKWIEVFLMFIIIALIIIRDLYFLFVIYGFFKELVSDEGS